MGNYQVMAALISPELAVMLLTQPGFTLRGVAWITGANDKRRHVRRRNASAKC